jgi:hypothetical protein
MNDTIQANPAKAGEIAQQIVALLVSEDSATRCRAIQAAMMLLGETASLANDPKRQGSHSDLSNDGDASDLGAFFNREENLKPSDHAQLCAAYHFSIYGAVPFSIDELRTIASNAGVVLPDRLDNTLKSATQKGKKLFQVAGKGTFRPTASAGLVFKEQWGVKPGKKAKGTATVKE